MLRALQLAELGWGQTAPNPMVGAVVVSPNGGDGGDGEVVGEGYHARYGEDHAEVVALKNAGGKARGATIYVTLEPCNHHGKTPPCTQAIIDAGIARVVCAVRDPNPKAAGGIEKLQAAGIDVTVGVEEEKARELNAIFFHKFTSDKPFVILKLALSADGAIAPKNKERTQLTGPEAQAEVQRLRAGVDAIGVGVGTVIHDDPLLTSRHNPPPRKQPVRVIFDRSGRTPKDSRLLRTATPEAPVRIISNPSIGNALRDLKTQGIDSILIEGGAEIAQILLGPGGGGSFSDSGIGATSVCPEGTRPEQKKIPAPPSPRPDLLIIFQSPIKLGPGALKVDLDLSGAREVRRAVFGNDTMTVYAFYK